MQECFGTGKLTQKPVGSGRKLKPNFLIVGAMKAGTASVYRYLEQHPQIFMSLIKEPWYFSLCEQDGTVRFPLPTNYDNANRIFTQQILNAVKPDGNRNTTIHEWDQYLALFKGVSDEIVCGEASTSYLYTPEAPYRIAERLGHIKLVALLRQPADRFASSYGHFIKQWGNNRSPQNLHEAWDISYKPGQTMQGLYFWHMRQMGHYHDQVRRYIDIFGKEHFKVYIFEEDLYQNEVSLMRDLFAFLEVDPDFQSDTSVIYGITGKPRNKLGGNLFKVSRRLRNRLRPVKRYLPHRIRRRLLSTLQAFENRLINKRETDPILRAEITEAYRSDIEKLQELLDRDLSCWL